MNKFKIFPCIKLDEKDASESCGSNAIVMVCENDSSAVLMFPATAKEASMVDAALGVNKKQFSGSLSLYRTMMESLFSGYLHLSGVILDVDMDNKKEEYIDVKLVIINKDGDIEGYLDTCFIHAVVLVAMEETNVIVTDRLLDKLLPPDKKPSKHTEISELEKKMDYPEDKKLLELAKKIMTGKLKE